MSFAKRFQIPQFMAWILLFCLTGNGIVVPLALADEPLPYDAPPESIFDHKEIEKALVHFYRHWNDVDPETAKELKEHDKNEEADAFASMISILPPENFNDIWGHILMEYRQDPKKRAPIEVLATLTYEKILPELIKNRERSFIMTVLDDVWVLWGYAYGFGFGKGLWRSRGSGLRGIAKFRHIVRSAVDNAPKFRDLRTKKGLALIGATTSAGVVHAIYEGLQTYKLDVKTLISQAQEQVLFGTEAAVDEKGNRVGKKGLAWLVVDLKKRLTDIKGMKFTDMEKNVTQLTDEVARLERELTEIVEELDHLAKENVAPHLLQNSELPTDLATVLGDCRELADILLNLKIDLELIAERQADEEKRRATTRPSTRPATQPSSPEDLNPEKLPKLPPRPPRSRFTPETGPETKPATQPTTRPKLPPSTLPSLDDELLQEQILP